jgi:hypothetical protein
MKTKKAQSVWNDTDVRRGGKSGSKSKVQSCSGIEQEGKRITQGSGGHRDSAETMESPEVDEVSSSYHMIAR